MALNLMTSDTEIPVHGRRRLANNNVLLSVLWNRGSCSKFATELMQGSVEVDHECNKLEIVFVNIAKGWEEDTVVLASRVAYPWLHHTGCATHIRGQSRK